VPGEVETPARVEGAVLGDERPRTRDRPTDHEVGVVRREPCGLAGVGVGLSLGLRLGVGLCLRGVEDRRAPVRELHPEQGLRLHELNGQTVGRGGRIAERVDFDDAGLGALLESGPDFRPGQSLRVGPLRAVRDDLSQPGEVVPDLQLAGAGHCIERAAPAGLTLQGVGSRDRVRPHHRGTEVIGLAEEHFREEAPPLVGVGRHLRHRGGTFLGHDRRPGVPPSIFRTVVGVVGDRVFLDPCGSRKHRVLEDRGASLSEPTVQCVVLAILGVVPAVDVSR